MRKLRWLFLLLALIGVILAGAGAYMVKSTRQFLSRAESAPGVVIENIWSYSSSRSSSNSGTYHPRVRFRTREGQESEFVSGTGSRPAAYHVNEEVTVLYDPEDPNRASIKSFWDVWLGPVILFPLAAVFLLGGILPLGLMRRRAVLKEWLVANGQRIQTESARVEPNMSVRVNGVHPFRIVSQWLNPQTGKVHVFRSENLWYDPSKYLGGTTVCVWIDPKNPKRYAMDTAFLPEIAD
jgi:hypothetical protein